MTREVYHVVLCMLPYHEPNRVFPFVGWLVVRRPRLEVPFSMELSAQVSEFAENIYASPPFEGEKSSVGAQRLASDVL